MWGEKDALYQGKDAYSSGTPCGRKFYWRAPTQSFFCHSLKQRHCRSLLNLECGLWCSLQGLSSGRRMHIYMCTCVSVLSPERIESKFLMEKYRKRSLVKDGDLGFYPDKTLNIHFTDGDLNGAWWCHIQLTDENPRVAVKSVWAVLYDITWSHLRNRPHQKHFTCNGLRSLAEGIRCTIPAAWGGHLRGGAKSNTSLSWYRPVADVGL